MPELKQRPSRRFRFFRVLKISGAFFLILLVGAYFLLRSEWLYQTLLFPRLAKTLGGNISVGSVDITPWRIIQLKKVQFKDTLGNSNTIDELSLRYQFLSLISGEAILEELYVKNANINLDHFLKKDATASTVINAKHPPELKEKTAELYPNIAFLFELKKVSFENVSLAVSGKTLGLADSKTIRLNNLNFKVNDFKSSSGGDLEFKFNFLTEGEQTRLPNFLEANLKTKIELQPNRERIGFRLKLELDKLKGKVNNIDLDDTSLSLVASIGYTVNGLTLNDVLLSVANPLFPKAVASLSADLSLTQADKNTAYNFKSLGLEIKSNDELIGNAKFVGDINTLDDITEMKGELSSSTLAIDKLMALWPKAETGSEVIKEEDKLTDERSNAFKADLQVKLASSTYDEITATNASGIIKFDEGLLRGEGIEMLVNSAPLKGSFIITLDEPMYKPTIDLDVQELEIQPVIRSIDKEQAKNLSGRLQRLTFKVKNSRSPDKVNELNRDGDFRAIFKDLKIPVYLQDTPPINLIFLPIHALDYASRRIGDAFLSADEVATIEAVEDENRSGQIMFNHAQVQGLINTKGATLSNTKFNSGVLPNFTFYGPIGFDGKLDLVVGIEILKVSIPLPVTGSLSLPYPNLPSFPMALIRSLGMSFTNIGDMFTSDEDLEEMFFEDLEDLELDDPL